MDRHSGWMSKMANWTIVLLPALAMWVPLGAEIGLFFILLAMAVAWLTGWRPPRDVWGAEQKYIAYALIAMIGVKALSAVWSIAPDLTWRHLRLHLHLLLYVPLLILFSLIKNKNQLFFSKALPWAIFPGAAWAMWEWMDNGYVFSGFDFSGAAKNSLVLSVLLTYIVCNLFFDGLQRPRYRHLWLGLMAALIMVMIGKRSTTLVMFVTFIFAWWVQRQKIDSSSALDVRMHGFKRVFPFIILLITFGLIGLTWAKWVLAWQETLQFFSTGYAGGSIDTRLELYRIAIQIFLSNPWLGVGAGTSRHILEMGIYSNSLANYNHYHQFLLQLLAETGVLGVIVWSVSLWKIQRSLNFIVSEQSGAIRLTAYTLILIALLFGATNLSFGNILFHIIFVYLLALVSSRPTTQNHGAMTDNAPR